MKKRVLISLLTIGLSMHLTGCTSSDSSKDQDDTAVATDDSFQEEGSGDFDDGSKTADKDTAPAEGNTDVAKTDDTGAAAGGDMAATPDAAASTDAAAASPAAGGDELALDSADPDKEFPDDVAKNNTPPAAGGDAAAAPTDQGLFDNPPAAQAEASAAPAAPAEPPAASPDTATTDVAAGAPADATAGVVASQAAPDTAPSASDLATNAGAGAGSATGGGDAPKKSFAPLQRVKDAPFEEKGANLNRYYVARAGDTTKAVAQKIYGSDRSKDLKAWNPTLKARSMKVGDKVYYNSPKDPQDTTKMMSFYEENGVPAQTYVTKDGDDLRDVSKKLLGSKDSWKEVWATNSNVESKGKVPAGVEVRYWPSGTEVAGGASAPAPNAKNNVAANGDAGGDQGLSDVPPPPPSDMQANNGGAPGAAGAPNANGNVPPPPDMNQNNPNGMPGAAAAGAVAGANGNVPPPPPDMNNGAPPPPPAQAAAPPPPPPPAPAQMNKKPAQVADSSTSDNDQTMMLGVGGFVVLGCVLAFSILRRKKASKARIDMTQTQV